MSRIRSVHPGLWTDEAFVCLTDAAQIFFIGLWTECDDQGAFEWKPVQLRLKLRGNRDGSIEPILAELEAANCIKSYEHNGRKYGLVRNFLRFQRPKKPNSLHFIPAELRTYTGSSGDVPPPVPHQFPTSGEKSPQMEDGGGRMEEGKGGEREKGARSAQDPVHKGVAEAILKDHDQALDEWEADFLHSIKAKPSLTKAQAESLKAIQSKLAAKGGTPPTLPTVKRGTPAYDAWIAHYRKKNHGRPSFYEARDSLTVPTEFPPSEVAA